MKNLPKAVSRKNTPAVSLGDHAVHQAQAAEFCPLGLLLSHDRKVVWCNPRFAAQFGYSRTELENMSLSRLYPSDNEFQRIGDRGHRVMLESGEYQDERLMRRHDGGLQWFRVHGWANDRSHPFDRAVWTFEALQSGVDTSKLTPREREVISAIARGLTAKECAKELNLSHRTVEKIRNNLREKYAVQNVAELMSRMGGLT